MVGYQDDGAVARTVFFSLHPNLSEIPMQGDFDKKSQDGIK
jgi:hypothetical protein